MEHKPLITLAYECALKNFKNKPFTFRQIWEELVKKAKLDKSERELVGQFYIDLLEDPRFIFIGGKKWRIREFLTSVEIANYENSLYDFDSEKDDAALLDKDVDFTADDQDWLNDEMFFDEDELKSDYSEYKKTHNVATEILEETENEDDLSFKEDDVDDSEEDN